MSIRKLAAVALVAGFMTGAQAAPTLAHDYQLNGSLADALGGPSLVAAGGTLGATSYSFGANQGLSLINGLANNGDYSIQTRFSFARNSSWNKIVDFKDRTDDNGFYVFNGLLQFYPHPQGSSAFATNTMYDIILTRDGGTGVITGFINGVQQWTVLDNVSQDGTFTGPNNIMQFFKDDAPTGFSEASAGTVDYIRIFDGILRPAEASCIQANSVAGCDIASNSGNDVPEPGSLALLGLGLAALAARKRKV